MKKREMVDALLSSGATQKEVSIRLGVPKSTVHARAAKLGLAKRNPPRFRNWPIIQENINRGLPYRKIAELLGFGHDVISRAIRSGHLNPSQRNKNGGTTLSE